MNHSLIHSFTTTGFIQVVAAQEEESVGEATQERRRRQQTVCRQADTVAAHEAAARVHQPQERRQPGRKAAHQVPVATQPAPGLRSVAGWTQDGVSYLWTLAPIIISCTHLQANLPSSLN